MAFDATIRIAADGVPQVRAGLDSLQAGLDGVSGSAAGVNAASTRAAQGVRALEQQTGMSARAMQSAMRGLPAQFTDIVTSLQSGQQPLTVLLQQGGQLKDMFGGIVPAAQALGTYIAGLVNPYTLAAAAVGVLTYGFIAGQRESANHARALIETGNAAGVTASQLSVLSQQLTATGASQGKTAEVIDSLVRAGVVGAQNLRDYAQAAIDLERAGGQAIEATAKQYASLAQDPAGGARKLSQETGLLTVAAYEQIKALQEQGQQTQAVAAAQRALAEQQAQMAPQMQQQLGWIERGWLAVKDAVGKTADEIKNLGREKGTQEAIELLQKQIAYAKTSIVGALDLPRLQAALKAYEQGAGYEARSAAEAQVAAEARKAGVKWLDQENQYLSKNQKLGLDILRTINEGNAAQASQAEIEARIALLRERADPGINIQQIKDAEAQKLEIVRQSQAEIDKQRQLGNLNEIQGLQASADLAMRAFDIRRQALTAELGIVRTKQDSEEKAAALSGQIAQLDLQRSTARIEAANAVTVAIYRQVQAAEALLRAFDEQTKSEIEQLQTQENLKQLNIAKATEDYARATDNSNEQLQLELRLMGATAQQRAVAIDQLRIQQQLKERERQIDQLSGLTSESTKDQLKANAREVAVKEMAQAEGRAYLNEWQRISDEISRSLTDALFRAFESGKDFGSSFLDSIKALLKTTVLKVLIQPVQSQINQIVGSIFMQSGGSGAAALGGAQSLSSLYTSGSTIATLIGAARQYGGSAAAYLGLGQGAATGATNAALAESAVGSAGYGASSASGAGSAAAGAASWVAAAIMGAFKANSDYNAGFNIGGARQVGRETGGISGTFESLQADLLKSLGVSDRLASLLSGSTAVAKIIGRAAPVVEGRNIVGTVGGDGFTGTFQERIREKGGLLRSDKVYTRDSALSADVVATIDTMAKQLRDQAKGYADALGLPLDALQKYSKAINVDVTFTDAEESAKRISEAMKGYADGLFDAIGTSVAQLKKAGETTQQTLERLMVLQTFSKGLNDLGGVFSRVAGLTVDARESFIALAGGMDQLKSQAQSFAQNYYSRDEIAGVRAREVQQALAGVGITQDLQTKDQFRSLVESLDVTTELGRKQLATLLGVADSFAGIADYLAETGGTLAGAAAQAPAAGTLGALFQSTAADQVTATNQVRDAIVDMHQDLAELIRSGQGGSSGSSNLYNTGPGEVTNPFSGDGGGG